MSRTTSPSFGSLTREENFSPIKSISPRHRVISKLYIYFSDIFLATHVQQVGYWMPDTSLVETRACAPSYSPSVAPQTSCRCQHLVRPLDSVAVATWSASLQAHGWSPPGLYEALGYLEREATRYKAAFGMFLVILPPKTKCSGLLILLPPGWIWYLLLC